MFVASVAVSIRDGAALGRTGLSAVLQEVRLFVLDVLFPRPIQAQIVALSDCFALLQVVVVVVVL